MIKYDFPPERFEKFLRILKNALEIDKTFSIIFRKTTKQKFIGFLKGGAKSIIEKVLTKSVANLIEEIIKEIRI